MGVLYSIGNALVDPLELQEKAALGTLVDFAVASSEGREAAIELSTGPVSTAEIAEAAGDPLGFEPIGLDKPLAVEIVAAYTGDAPGRSWFDRIVGRSKPDLLITSAAKSPHTFGAAPRAINQVVEDIDDKKSYRPSALSDGSPIIYYSPAMVDATTFVGVEMVVDSFSGGVFDQLSKLLAAAAGLPVFAPGATYLLAGSVASRIGKKLAEALTETGPFLKADEDIRFDSGGFPVELARFMLFAADADLPELKAYSPEVVDQSGNVRVVLAHRQSGDPYDGDVPFVIATVDGRERPEYKDFKATHASAAMLEQFYGKNALTGAVSALTEAMTLYNDLKFRRAAERMRAERDALPEGSSEREAADTRVKAYLENIRTEELRSGVEEEE